MLEGGALIGLPYEYELIELDPEIAFTSPENLTETNTQCRSSLHVRDIGAGFLLSDLMAGNRKQLIPTNRLDMGPRTDGRH